MTHRLEISRGILEGKVSIPSSKSQTLRAILFGALGSGTSVIHHCLSSPDTESMIAACRLLGADVECLGEDVQIRGVGGGNRVCRGCD